MGIGPLNAIYQARFMRYLENRGLIEKTDRKVWAFVGDGETDEVDTLGAISLGSREKLDNLIFVVNCNLQRLDGPVRGNKRIIDELEGMFRGAGWNVIKVIWGSDWDELFDRDHKGLLLKRMEECVDGDFQAFKAKVALIFARSFSESIRSCWSWSRIRPTKSWLGCTVAGMIPARSTTLTSERSSTRAARR
jgi:pyruvate dehydrogenase E1 component